jgi:hypothetical protein
MSSTSTRTDPGERQGCFFVISLGLDLELLLRRSKPGQGILTVVVEATEGCGNESNFVIHREGSN